MGVARAWSKSGINKIKINPAIKFRLLFSKREVQIVPIPFGLVRKRVSKWPIWVILLSCLYIYIYLTQNKMNLFVLSGHGSESFAALLNGVILQKNNAAVITAAVITTHHESKLRFK